MSTGYIDFISAYCDRWCERCQFTLRCSAYSAEAAIAMCGDVAEGLELAVGRPAEGGIGPAEAADRDWLADFDDAGMSAEELADDDRQERARRARVDGDPIVKSAWAVSMLAHHWFTAKAASMQAAADPVVNEALTIAMHDAAPVTVKLHRAIDGPDRFAHGEEGEAHPVQNDWNGSAKLALICLDRSAAAWRVLAQSSGEETSAAMADQLDALRCQVEEGFPNARAFIRPGFDKADE